MAVRRRWRTYVWGLLLAVVLLVMAMSVMTLLIVGRDFSVRLPRGYSIIRIHGNNVVLTKEGWYVLGPEVDLYRDCDPFVIGHVSAYPGEASVAGYFVLDTRTDALRKGLSKDEWRKVLRDSGLSTEPRLGRPTGYAALFSMRRHRRGQ